MAGYGAARVLPANIASLLEEVLEEEKSADKKLTSIASSVNRQAKQAA